MSYIGSLDKSHTSIFNALIKLYDEKLKIYEYLQENWQLREKGLSFSTNRMFEVGPTRKCLKPYLFCDECTARSACTYVNSDLALHSPLSMHYGPKTKGI